MGGVANKGKPRPDRLVPVQSAVDTAVTRLPNMTPSFVAYPGTPFTSTCSTPVESRCGCS